MLVEFQKHPDSYRHWKFQVEQDLARLTLQVNEDAGLFEGYKLKLNSYDLSVDMELADALMRIRFEHPQVKAVVITSANDRIFSAGANIFMLGLSSHSFKVNFCKFTNETRLAMEDASACSGIRFLCAANGITAGGGYELALACDEIVLVDDGSSAVSLPEVPLLGVLPGTGGLTRVVDKRKVRRDLADFFCTTAEGVKGQRAVEYKLVDQAIPKSEWHAGVEARAQKLAASSQRKKALRPIELKPLTCDKQEGFLSYDNVKVMLNSKKRMAEVKVLAPTGEEPKTLEAFYAKGSDLWVLKTYRELEDAILQLRFNHPDVGLIVFKTEGNPNHVLEAEQTLLSHVASADSFANEILLYMKRVLKKIDVTSRSMAALVEPGSAFAGSLAELVLIADRSYMLSSAEKNEMILSPMNQGSLPMGNGLTRLETRYISQVSTTGPLDAHACEQLGLVTFVLDEIDYEDEVRIFLEERTSFSPDALTGMEANLRFVGPETLETKIFARLSAWQNWIFTRDNATGEQGALTNYGKPTRPQFNFERC